MADGGLGKLTQMLMETGWSTTAIVVAGACLVVLVAAVVGVIRLLRGGKE